MGKRWLIVGSVGLLITSGFGCNNKTNTKAGIIEADEVWSGKINIMGDVFLPEGVSLRITPKTEISFSPQVYRFDGVSLMKEQFPAELMALVDNQKCDFIIAGKILAVGKEAKQIRIGNDLWDGSIIFCGGNNQSIIKYCRIQGGFVGIRCLNSTQVEISKSKLTGNDWGIICGRNSSPKILNNIIEDNRIIGIAVGDFSFPAIYFNTISQNPEGVIIQNQANPELRDNIFTNNGAEISDHR